MRVKNLAPPVDAEPARKGEDVAECASCQAPDDAYVWVSERWRVRAMDRPTGLPMVLILEARSHLDLGDLPNLLAAELGVMTVRLERAIRSLDGVARVHVNRWGDSSAHLHMWFLARPKGQLQLRGTFLSLWDGILPPVPEAQWRENLAMVAAWLEQFGGTAIAEPPHIEWQAPSSFTPEAARPKVSEPAVVVPAEANEPQSVALAEGPAEEVAESAEKPTGAATADSSRPAVGGDATATGADKKDAEANGAEGDNKDGATAKPSTVTARPATA